MAGLGVHLIIAREIYKRLPQGIIENEGMFYAGSIAPDAIHVRPNYIREWKKHTHLRDDIMDQDFTKKHNLDLFHDRVAEFILQNRDRRDGLLDVYRGYVVHLLTDELYLLTIRQEFVEMMEKQGISQNDREFFYKAVTEMNRSDFLLINHYPEMGEIRLSLEKVKPFGLKSLLSESELSDSREWVLNWFFHEIHEPLEPEYTTLERNQEFVRMAAGDITQRLSEGGSIPRMF